MFFSFYRVTTDTYIQKICLMWQSIALFVQVVPLLLAYIYISDVEHSNIFLVLFVECAMTYAIIAYVCFSDYKLHLLELTFTLADLIILMVLGGMINIYWNNSDASKHSDTGIIILFAAIGKICQILFPFIILYTHSTKNDYKVSTLSSKTSPSKTILPENMQRPDMTNNKLIYYLLH